MIQTDIAIIGAGPVGLFAVFEAGLLKMRCHLIDFLPRPGGQLSEIYPKKPIYDIPGYPSVLAQDLVDNLMEQNKPFHPTFTLGERVEMLEKRGEGDFYLKTNVDTEIAAKAVVIAGGLGVFEPRKPVVEGLADFENGRGVNYMIIEPEDYRNKKMVLAGGGDAALDWTIYLADVAEKVILVHRRGEFRGAPDSVDKVKSLAQEGKIDLLLYSDVKKIMGNGHLRRVEVENNQTKEVVTLDADYLIPLFGLSPKLGPIADWGLNIDKMAVEVNTDDYSTNVSGIWAIGDINTYVNKLKLILCGFHEAALMSHSVYRYLHPDKKDTLKYTTVNGIHGF